MTWEPSRGRGQKANIVALGFRRGRSGEGTHLRGQDERLGARKDSGFNDWVEGSTIY